MPGPCRSELLVRKLVAHRDILGGSWVVISRVISRVTILMTHIKGLISPPITTPEPPSILFYHGVHHSDQ